MLCLSACTPPRFHNWPSPAELSILCSELDLFVLVPFLFLGFHHFSSPTIPNLLSVMVMTAVVETPALEGSYPQRMASKEDAQGLSREKSTLERPSNTPPHAPKIKRHKRFYMPEGDIVIQVWRLDDPFHEFPFLKLMPLLRWKTLSSAYHSLSCTRIHPSYGAQYPPYNLEACRL